MSFQTWTIITLVLFVGIYSGQVEIHCSDGNCPTLEDEQRLQNKLMEGYNRNLRPTMNRMKPTQVGVDFGLNYIKGFDEKSNSFSYVGIFTFKWHSDNLMWNKTEYGGIQSTTFPQSNVWIPQLLQGNAYSDIIPLGSGEDNQDIPVRILSNGDSIWHVGGVFEVTCPGDMKFYPFDYQICEIANSPFFQGKNEIFLFKLGERINTDFLIPSGQWELVDHKFEIRDFRDSHLFLVTLKIRRFSMFYVVNVIVPVIVIGILNILVFVMPPESGERVGFSVTVLLSMSVFLTIVSDNLPEASQPNLSLLSYFLLSDLLICTLMTGTVIFGLRFHHQPSDAPVPFMFSKLTRIYLCCCCITGRTKSKYGLQPVSTARVKPKQNGMGGNLHAISDSVTWPDFASFFDLISFVWYSMLLLVKNIALIVVMITHIHNGGSLG